MALGNGHHQERLLRYEGQLERSFFRLGPETQFLLDRKALAQLKVGCLLVNVARGSLVDETAVVDLIASGNLGGLRR
jgi:hypothetical protein